MKLLVLLLYTIAYLYIIFEPHISSVTTFLLGIAAVLLTSRFNFSELSTIVDFNTIFILAGMMIIISILKEQGIFTEISKRILLISKGNIVRTVFLINMAIFFLSGFLDNVTTILIFIPILFYIADAIQIDAKPLLISSVFFSNLGGMTTAIGDPPNIIIYSVSKQSFISFVTHLMPVGVVVLFLQLFLLGKKLETHGMNFVFDTQSIKQDAKNPQLIKYLVIFLIVLIAMTFHEQLDIEL
ncbi:SLC13 family permease [Fervidobacterium sp.]